MADEFFTPLERWLQGLGPGSFKTPVEYEGEEPGSPRGYRTESPLASQDPDYEQQFGSINFGLGEDKSLAKLGATVSQMERGHRATTTRGGSASLGPVGVNVARTGGEGFQADTRGISLRDPYAEGPSPSLTVSQTRAPGMKPQRTLSAQTPLGGGSLEVEASKGTLGVGYSKPLDVGTLELLAVKDPQALAALLQYKLKF